MLSCMVCSNFEPLGRTNQKTLRLCHQKWIPHSLEHWFWSERSNLSPEQKNSISVFSLGVFFDFLNLMFSWLCGVFRILWCYFLLLWYFSTFVVFLLLLRYFSTVGVFFLLYWYFLTFVVLYGTCGVFFYFWSIFWLLGYFLTFVVFFFYLVYFWGVIA